MKMGPNMPDRAHEQAGPVTAGRPEAADARDTRARLAELADTSRLELLREENHRSAAASRDLGGKERIAELKRRIAAKYYDRPEIMERIADQLADDV
jgi:hypothetical protein